MGCVIFSNCCCLLFCLNWHYVPAFQKQKFEAAAASDKKAFLAQYPEYVRQTVRRICVIALLLPSYL